MKRTNLKRIFAGLLAALLLVLAGCAISAEKQTAQKDDSLQKVLDAGQLVLGLDVSFPPMGFTDENGEIVGFDIDVAQEVCKRLGVRLVKQGIDWDQKEDDLNGGKIDCIWNGFSVTPERAEKMNLSEPYMKNELIVVVLKGSDAKILADLKGRTVGVQKGATAQEVLEASKLFPDIEMKTYDTVETVVERLNEKEIDAALIDSVFAYHYVFPSDNEYFSLSESLSEEEYAIGFRKGDGALRDKVQEILREMKADGTLGKISQKWFDSDITIVK